MWKSVQERVVYRIMCDMPLHVCACVHAWCVCVCVCARVVVESPPSEAKTESESLPSESEAESESPLSEAEAETESPLSEAEAESESPTYKIMWYFRAYSFNLIRLLWYSTINWTRYPINHSFKSINNKTFEKNSNNLKQKLLTLKNRKTND